MHPHHIGVLTETTLDLTTIEAVAAHFGATIHIKDIEEICAMDYARISSLMNV